MAKYILLITSIFILSCVSSTKNSDEALIQLKLGTQYLIKGQTSSALSALLEAEKLDPNNAVVQNNLALAYFAKSDFSQAETKVKNALRLDPNYSDARNNLGRIYIELTRYDEAIKELDIVTKDLKYGPIEKAYVNTGLAYLKKGEYPTALVQFRKAIDANNKFCPAHNYYGQAQFQLQKFDEATESFETALKLCHNNYDEAHYYSGLSYYKIGQKEKAIARLEEVVRLYPETEFAEKAKSMLKIIR